MSLLLFRETFAFRFLSITIRRFIYSIFCFRKFFSDWPSSKPWIKTVLHFLFGWFWVFFPRRHQKSLQDSFAAWSMTWYSLLTQRSSVCLTLHLSLQTLMCFWSYEAENPSRRSALLIEEYGFKTCSARNDGQLDCISKQLLLIELRLVKASMKLNVFVVSADGCLGPQAEWVHWQVRHNKFNYKQEKNVKANDRQGRKMSGKGSNNIKIIIFWCVWCRESPCILLWRWTCGLGSSWVLDKTFFGFTASWVSLLSLGWFWPSLLLFRSFTCFSYLPCTCMISICGRS